MLCIFACWWKYMYACTSYKMAFELCMYMGVCGTVWKRKESLMHIYRKCCKIIRHLHRFPFTLVFVVRGSQQQQQHQKYSDSNAHTKDVDENVRAKAFQIKTNCVCFERWSYIRTKINSKMQWATEREHLHLHERWHVGVSKTINSHSQKYMYVWMQNNKKIVSFSFAFVQKSMRCSEAHRNMKWK